MHTNEKAVSYWKDFCRSTSSANAETAYQVWYFGNTSEMALELVNLVLSGKKTATASALETNKLQPENAPLDNGYSVVTDLEGNPMCVIQTAEIRHIPFNAVDSAFAYDEGEEDQTIESWRKAHWNYFTQEAARLGFVFDENSIVCCERFRLLYP